MTDLVTQVLNIGIVGAAVSLTMKLLKNKFGNLKSDTAKIATLILSLAGGTGIYFLSQTPYWLAFIGVLGTASTIYAFVIKK